MEKTVKRANKKKQGLTLLEIVVVLGIFVFLLSGIFAVLTDSDRFWRQGQAQLSEQQEARRALETFSRLIRDSNPDWEISGTHYPVTISESNQRIDFYNPVFDPDGIITDLKKITFKLNPTDPSQLLKKEGVAAETLVAQEIESINFLGGCAGCASINCTTVASDCPIVQISVTTRERNSFTLTSKLTLRNTKVALDEDVEVEQPDEGEF